MQRIGLYGGSFDPIHTGHLLVGQAALEELQLDRLIFIPTAKSPFKSDSTPASGWQRLAMARLALCGKTNCEVDDLEIQRGGTSFTIDTVRHYRERFPAAQFYYLIGADNVPALPKWRDAEALAKLTEFAVIPRPGEPTITLPPPFRLKQLVGFPNGISASQIRERIKIGRTIDHLVGPTVAEFIRNNRLYL